MEHMSTNEEVTRRNYGGRSQLANWILESGATCHMTPDIQDFILSSLVETDKSIKVAYGKFFPAKTESKISNKNA